MPTEEKRSRLAEIATGALGRVADRSPIGGVLLGAMGIEGPQAKMERIQLDNMQRAGELRDIQTERERLALAEDQSQAKRRPVLESRADAEWANKQAEMADRGQERGKLLKRQDQELAQNDIHTEAMQDRAADMLLDEHRTAAANQFKAKLTAAWDSKYGRGVGGQGMTDDQVAEVLANNPQADDMAQLWTAGRLAMAADSGDEKAKRAMVKHLRDSNITIEEGKDGKKELVDADTGTRLPYDMQTFASAWDTAARPAAQEMAGRIISLNNQRTAAGRSVNALSAAAIENGLIGPSEVGMFQLMAKDAIMGGAKLDKSTPRETLQQVAKEVNAFSIVNKMQELTEVTDPTQKQQLSQSVMTDLADGGIEAFGGQIVPQVELGKDQDIGNFDIRSMRVKFIKQGQDPRIPPWEGTLPELVTKLANENPVTQRLMQMFKGLALRKAEKDAKNSKPNTRTVDGVVYEVQEKDGKTVLVELPTEGATSTPTDAGALNFSDELLDLN